MANNDVETHNWTKYYSAGYEHLGPTACGAPGSKTRRSYTAKATALALGRSLHSLLTDLQSKIEWS